MSPWPTEAPKEPDKPTARGRSRKAKKCGPATLASPAKPCARLAPHVTTAPDPELFARAGGRWRVQLAALTGAPQASPAHLRTILAAEAGDLKTFGADTDLEAIPDDLLVTAAMSGATTSMAFLDILDGACFAHAPCLCCYTAHSAARAREAATALRVFRQYFDTGSYVRSRAYARAVAAMLRDLRPEEAAEVKAHIARLDTTPDTVREINGSTLGGPRGPGLCVALPSCQPGVLWVYSTPEGRRLLRHLARKGGGPVKVTVASSDPGMAPRFRYRMYAASLVACGPACGTAGHGNSDWPRGAQATPPAPRAGPASLLDTALAWVRAHGDEAKSKAPLWSSPR